MVVGSPVYIKKKHLYVLFLQKVVEHFQSNWSSSKPGINSPLEDAKIRSLTNEVIRRMVTTSKTTPEETRCQILDRLAQKMANSGYGVLQIRRVILAGIKGYEKMLRLEKKGKRKLHRTAKESSSLRSKKKLTGKSEWFRKQEIQDSSPEELDEDELAEKKLDKWLKDGKAKNNEDKSIPTRTVLFVENTRGGELAKRLREVEKRTQRMTGFKTKIVEGVGSKLKNLLSNSNPWKGSPCGRICIPCGQPGEKKQDCRKRNIIYESKCIDCNPEKEKYQKDGKELEDSRAFPSIYVGESGRSLHERAKEHWSDFESRSGDSHILKHWLNHHGGQGTPKFRIDVIKYCQDTLTRQVGEAVRIQYRGQTLNSKSGFNRSGLSRLVLPEPKEDDNDEPPDRIDEVAEPRGLNFMSRSLTGVKRKDVRRKEYIPKSKRRRKLEYEVIDEDWGLAIGEDMTRIEKEEERRNQFLKAGDMMDKKVGTNIKQSTFKTWSRN